MSTLGDSMYGIFASWFGTVSINTPWSDISAGLTLSAIADITGEQDITIRSETTYYSIDSAPGQQFPVTTSMQFTGSPSNNYPLRSVSWSSNAFDISYAISGAPSPGFTGLQFEERDIYHTIKINDSTNSVVFSINLDNDIYNFTDSVFTWYGAPPNLPSMMNQGQEPGTRGLYGGWYQSTAEPVVISSNEPRPIAYPGNWTKLVYPDLTTQEFSYDSLVQYITDYSRQNYPELLPDIITAIPAFVDINPEFVAPIEINGDINFNYNAESGTGSGTFSLNVPDWQYDLQEIETNAYLIEFPDFTSVPIADDVSNGLIAVTSSTADFFAHNGFSNMVMPVTIAIAILAVLIRH